MKTKWFYFIIAAIALAADQLTKAWATVSLQSRGSLEVVEGFFRLSYARNRGVAFSLFADSEFETKWVLATISAVAAVAVIYYLGRTAVSSRRLNTALALLLAGITGNLIDRVRLGEVVDFIEFHWADKFIWPTFNLADASICLGAALLALELIREERAASVKAQTSAPAPEEGSVSSSE